MRRALLRFPMIPVFMVTVAGFSGCTGEPKYVVTGRVTYKGAPMEVKPMVGKLRLWLVQQDVPPPVDAKEAAIQPDGTFVVKSGESGIPAGKYKVCVTWQDNFPFGPDRLDKKFDEKNSKIFRTIPDDKNIEIDVSRPEG